MRPFLLLAVLLGLIVALSVACGGGSGNSSSSANPSAAPSATPSATQWLVNQNFEGIGFDNYETWITYAGNTGAADPNYTSALRGNYSLHMKDDDNEGTYAVTKFFNIYTFYGFFQFEILDYPSDRLEIMHTYNIQGPNEKPTLVEPHEMLWISTGGVLSMFQPGGDFTSGYTAIRLNTKYYIWFYVTRGADGYSDGWVKISQTATIPDKYEITWKDIRWNNSSQHYHATNAIGFTTYHGGGYEYIVDQVLVSEAAIGNAQF